MRANDTYGAEIARATAYKLLAECYYPPDEHSLTQAGRLCREAGTVCTAAASSPLP